MTEFAVRQARADDYDAVVDFTSDTWSDREEGDYIPDVFHEWVENDGEAQRTLVLDADGEAAGIVQVVLLTDAEAWARGMRIAPDVRGEGAGSRLTNAALDWAAEQGASVCRNLVFGWNDAGMGQSRAVGFDPAAEVRVVTPEPAGEASLPEEIVENPDAAWTYWTASEGRNAVSGLGLHPGESWACSELTRERLHDLADEQRVLAVVDENTAGMTVRSAVREREGDEGEREAIATYAMAAWRDLDTARTLFQAIRADAAAIDADSTRVLLPETPRHVSDAATVRADIADYPTFLFSADLATRR
jgi:GNAT superfamily N-acetyltransferase